MKKILPLFICLLFFLGSCTETIYEEVIKLDTIYLTRPSFSETVVITHDTVRDTVQVNVIIQKHDTVFQVVTRDSIIVKEITVNHYDTIYITQHDTITQTIHDTVRVYDRSVVYLDTFVVVSYMRPTESIPDDIIPIVEEFYRLSHQYGKNPPGGVMIIQYVAELFGENWVSSSFEVSDNGQQVIYLDQRLPAAMHRNSIFREMSRLQLNKKYSADVSKIMCPWFPYDKQATTKELNELFK